MGLFRSGIEKEFAHYRRQKVLAFMDEVPYTTTQLHQDKAEILDAAHKYGKRVLVHDVYSSNPHEPSFVATPDGQWLTVDEWVESQRRQLPSSPRTPAEIYRAAVAKSGPDILTRAGMGADMPGFDDTGMWEMLFEQAVERFNEEIAGDGELADEDVESAIAFQASLIVGTPEGALPDTSDPIFQALVVAGRAGYTWRTVESEKQKAFGFVGDELEEVFRSVAVHGGDRTTTLALAAEQALEKGITFQWESPGGMLRGRDFLEAGYDYVLSGVLEFDGGDIAGEQALRRMFFVGVLIRDMDAFTGPAPLASSNTSGTAPVEQKLGRELFERDRDAYIRLAGWIVSDSARPQLPEALQRITTRTFVPLSAYFDPEMQLGGEITPLAGAIGRFYAEILSGAYLLAAREEWEGFDVSEVNRLVDDCLATNGQSAIAEEDAARIAGGVSGQLDDYAALTAYVDGLPAHVRLGAFADTFVVYPGDTLKALMEKDESVSQKVGVASTLGWTAGVMLALLEKAGRIKKGATA